MGASLARPPRQFTSTREIRQTRFVVVVVVVYFDGDGDGDVVLDALGFPQFR